MGISRTEVISIHAPTRGATFGFFDVRQLSFGFQSTLPQGERHYMDRRKKGWIYFNPRSHKGSDPQTSGNYRKCSGFQSTLPQGERLCRTYTVTQAMEFQSTLPQGERQLSTKGQKMQKLISIHAPTRGATGIEHKASTLIIFQSTLPQGERQQFSPILGLVLR